MWEVKVEGIELPEGWHFMEEIDFLHLVNPEGEVKMSWSRAVPIKTLKQDVSQFFANQGQS